MNALKALSSFRLLNIILIIAAQIAAYQRLHVDILDRGTAEKPELSLSAALLLAFSSGLMMMFGNFHNDWVDMDFDLKFSKKNLWSVLPKKPYGPYLLAITFFLSVFLTLLPPVFAIFPWATAIVIGCGLLLIAYNTRLKCIPILGNLSVAALSAFGGFFAFWIALWSMELEFPQEFLVYSDMHSAGMIFLAFSFFLSLSREMIKDVEDSSRDIDAGCKTIGNSFKPKLQQILISIPLLLLLWLGGRIFLWSLELKVLMVSGFFGLILILLLMATILIQIDHNRYSKWISVLLKIILFLGVSSLFWLPFEKFFFYGV